MILSETGRIAYKLWYELPDHFSFVSLDEFVVMPNHVHGIVIIQSPTAVGTLHADTLQLHVGTLHATSLLQSATSQQSTPSLQSATPLRSETFQHHTENEFMSTISPKPGSLATVIRSYKSAVSKNVHLIDPDFSWQPLYYDHIIRSDRELDRIRDYIINNPVKWDYH